jgi:hypothetical protein
MNAKHRLIVGFSALLTVNVMADEPYSAAGQSGSVTNDNTNNRRGVHQINRSNAGPVIGGMLEDGREVPERYRNQNNANQNIEKRQEKESEQKEAGPESGW